MKRHHKHTHMHTISVLTFAHRTAFSRHCDRVEAVMAAGSSYTAGLAAHTLTECAVVLSPVIPMSQDLSVYIAAGKIQCREDRICRKEESEKVSQIHTHTHTLSLPLAKLKFEHVKKKLSMQ